MESRKWLIILGLGLISSCSMFSSDDKDEPEIVYTNLLASIGDDQLQERIDVNAQLAEAASSVTYSLNKMAQIQLANTPKTPFEKADKLNTIKGMSNISSIDWNGPVEPILRKIAKAGKHKYRSLGKVPAIPVIVDLHMKNVPLADILRNTTYQTAGKARITYLEKEDIIELRYLEI